jgi:hypothetical protein
LYTATDEQGKAYGCKTATLELVGVLLPFLTIPHLLRGRSVRLQVDNSAAVYGWLNMQIKNDTTASILIRTLHIISHFLECTTHVEHLPRLSTRAARLADRLSRKSSTTKKDLTTIRKAMQPRIPAELRTWLANPSPDWSLPGRLLTSVKEIMKSTS